MSVGSPHLYRQQVHRLDVPEEIVEAAISQSAIVQGRGFASVLSLGHLAHRTGAPYDYLRGIVERRRDAYHSFAIRRKGDAPPRLISSPEPTLMDVQRWILRRILRMAASHSASYAYEEGKNIRMCAEQHLGARWLVKLDLHNFFHSIDECRVYNVFLELGYSPLPAFEMARICTRQASFRGFPDPVKFEVYPRKNTPIPSYSADLLGFLPQGSPTSGAIANLVAARMDEKLAVIACRKRLVYTRYSDDIVLSSSGPFSRSAALGVVRLVSEAAGQCGFEIHKKKTRVVPPGARRVVLGLLVDSDRVHLSKQVRRRIDLHLFGVEKFGLASHQRTRGFSSVLGMAKHIEGLLAFAYDVDPIWTSGFRERWQQVLRRDAPMLAPDAVKDVYLRRHLSEF
jgi:RNA-directed DNA polymerase